VTFPVTSVAAVIPVFFEVQRAEEAVVGRADAGTTVVATAASARAQPLEATLTYLMSLDLRV
jgi:hypothetical protein